MISTSTLLKVYDLPIDNIVNTYWSRTLQYASKLCRYNHIDKQFV